ncbi:hypothetical protein FHS27_003129 [Rhodopirellula rubra]|uniref:Alginate lyase 2 domain-containing protein n=1 Tax=Aporhodopirellula rubra TaxID=980271 RepID=A0A7W5H6G8_9BACT|nr:polysaccharide lyase family 7 protein [Aporhodopirellula rubra]MBB3207308.1 hypothetical protein [Aporhodopirellula rubra]
MKSKHDKEESQTMMTLTRSLATGLCAAAFFSAVVAPVQGQDAPYDLEKFRSVLDDSKLQAPTSSPTKIKQGDFRGASNEYFFLDKTGRYMTFTVEGDSNRSELRQSTGDWDTATETPQRLIARVRVFVPEDEGLEQFTFLQIHDKKNGSEGLNKPLLRLTRRSDYRDKQDHLWAHIRTPENGNEPISLKNFATKNVDLGPRPEGFFDVEIRVQKSRMTVAINGQTKVDMDVSYWNGLNNYFKAGVYNQNNGRSKVEFESLRFSNSDN